MSFFVVGFGETNSVCADTYKQQIFKYTPILMTMANPDVKYSSVTNEGNPFIQQHTPTIQDDELATDSDNDDAPQNSGIMIHVVPDTSKCTLLDEFKFLISGTNFTI